VKRGGFFHGPVAARITGTGARTVHPRSSTCARTGASASWDRARRPRARVCDRRRAFLDGAEVTDRCYVYKERCSASHRSTRKASRTCSGVGSGASARAQFPRQAITPSALLPSPRLLLGETDWQLDVEEGAFDASAFDGCVFALPGDDAARNALPPCARVELLWREHEPFTVRLLIPSGLQSLETTLLDGESLRTLVRAGLERFRAAGVRLTVDRRRRVLEAGHRAKARRRLRAKGSA
jgi:hypothetical protein